MPVESVSLTPDKTYLDIQFEGGANFRIYIKNSTVDDNGDDDLRIYGFNNPDFVIGITNNSFQISISDTTDIIYYDTISDDLIEELEDIMDTLNTIKISNAPHIGILKEGTDIVINDRNSISLDDFEDGEECVLIKHPNGNFTANGERCFVYHIDSLQGWFDAGNNSEPLTRVPITQAMLQRFKYSKPSGASSSRKSNRRKTRKGKARK
jgi:hypothetical protein